MPYVFGYKGDLRDAGSTPWSLFESTLIKKGPLQKIPFYKVHCLKLS